MVLILLTAFWGRASEAHKIKDENEQGKKDWAERRQAHSSEWSDGLHGAVSEKQRRQRTLAVGRQVGRDQMPVGPQRPWWGNLRRNKG